MATTFEMYRGSSKFFVVMMLFIIIPYFMGHILKLWFTDIETKVSLISTLLFSYFIESSEHSQ